MASINSHPSTQPKQASAGAQEFPVGDSSFLQNIKYDPATYQLTVTMKSGAQYVHFYVYPQTFQDMCAAPSKGKFYADVIKKSGTPAMRVVTKSVGPQVRNPLKGPVNHERKPTRR